MEQLLLKLKQSLLIPVVAVDNLESVIPLAQILEKAGIKFLEITYRNENAGKALQILKEQHFDLTLGAGTIRTLDQAKDAIENGAQFMVSPGFNREIIQYCHQQDIPFIPGVDSTLSIELAVAEGLRTLKFFPAGISGGSKWLKAVKGPYFDIKFIPTGGISIENLGDYASLSNVVGIGGSFLAPKSLINQKDWDQIFTICVEALSIVNKLKNKE